MQFFQTLWLSISSPRFYITILRKPISFSWTYFFLLHVVIAGVLMLVFAIPLFSFDLTKGLDNAAKIYPPDLEVTLHKEGRITINQPLPYSIPMPEAWRNQDGNDASYNAPSSLAIFDTDQSLGRNGLASYDAFIVVTEHMVYMIPHGNVLQDGRFYQVPRGEEDFIITRPKIDQIVTTFSNNFFIRTKLFKPLLLIALFLILYAMIVMWRVAVLLFFTFFTWMLSIIFLADRRFSYWKLFQVSMHSFTLILFIGYFADALGLQFFGSFVYFFAFLLWTMYILSQINPLPESIPVIKKRSPARRKGATKKKSAR